VRDLSGALVAKAVVLLFPLLVLMGTAILIYGGYMLHKSAQSSSWPSVDGVIRTVKIEEQTSNSGDHGPSTTYAAGVTYDYAFDGKTFSGNRIRMVRVFSSDQSYAMEDERRYPVGKTVKVFYSPTDPADSVLEPGVHPSSWFLPIVGAAFIVIPALMMSIAFATNVFRKQRRVVETNPF